ncbi:Tubulin-tyrosine ligase family protein [Histomonas meleagridis]|nr:Tubulin-tyrosine ligase family protein [Histomonas meleagridis]
MEIVLDNIAKFYPNEYNFIPKTFLLPSKQKKFISALTNTGKTYIVKPSLGSLGNGIKIYNSPEQYQPSRIRAVAQEYIESYLIDDTKFDLRVYALIASVNPLRIYVYHDGIARFCTEKAGNDSIFSQLTNVAINKKKVADGKDISEISRFISDVFQILKDDGIDTDKLWVEIEDCIGLTIISSLKFILKSEVGNDLTHSEIPRCFQILGFDILLDKNAKPYVLEVNYRPLLNYYRGKEKRLKSKMIADAILLSAPFSSLQELIDSRMWGWDEQKWKQAIHENNIIKNRIRIERKEYEKNTLYHKVWPSKKKHRKIWSQIINKVMEEKLPRLPGITNKYKTLIE